MLFCASHKMPEQSVIVWDLETVRDIAAAVGKDFELRTGHHLGLVGAKN